ncbi:MAG: hypothetical protein ABIS50_04185 [Luteolibacter sp.]|uniref:hypothetical protein n=1 Tax=Luteolibacter sp. TaxID=1962973 RepID=UPI0032653759
MKRTNLIVTHAAVFSVGIAAAMIFNGSRDSQSPSTSSDNARSSRSGSSAATGSLAADGIRTPRSGSDDARALSKKESKTPTERMSDIVRLTDPFQRQRAMMDLIDTLGPDQFAAVAEQFRQLDHFGDSRGEYDLILRGWAKADPLSALDYVSKQPNNRGASATILSTWAGNDASGAERWAIDHFTGEGANPYMSSVIRGIATTDISHASELALAMPSGRERGDAVSGITDALFMQGLDAAMAYPASITGDDQLRGGFVAAIANRLIGKDPDQAATWLASMDQGDIQNRASRQVADALARTDTSKAAAWVKTLKPEAQAEAARGVIPIMSTSDITATAQWVTGLAGTPGYDNVVEEFVWSCNGRAPEQSAAWIQGVSNPDQQRRLYHRMLGEWAQQDPAAVKQWVATNNVPDDVRRRFSR